MHSTRVDDQLLITVEDAARRLRVGRTTLYNQLRRGLLPSVRVGRCRRIAISDLDLLIDRLREASDRQVSDEGDFAIKKVVATPRKST